MKSDFTLKNIMKLDAMLVMLIAFCDIVIVIFFQGLSSRQEWEMEILKISVLLLLSMIIILLLFRLKAKRKVVGYVLGGEMFIFSVMLFTSLINGYYTIYNVVNRKLIFIYAVLTIVAYLLSRKVSRKLCEKLSSGEKVDDKVSHKIEDGTLNGIVLCTILFSRHLTMEGTYIVNCVISLIICFFWMFAGFFMFVMKPMDD